MESPSRAGSCPSTVDVPGGQQSLTFALSISAPGIDSGLIDSQTGNHVYLFVENGVVVGREGVNAGAAAAGSQDFTLSVDASGKLTLTDLRSVHEGSGEAGDISEGTHLSAGLVSLTATVTDNNNQSASASVDVGPHLTLLDDGPSISASVERELPFLRVDESFLPNGTTPNPTFTHDSGNFSGAFSHVNGADGATISYALAASGATDATGVDSGLLASGTGHTVYMFLQGGEIIGREGTDPTSAASGAEVFTIELNSTSGEVTLTQLRAVHEGSGENPDLNESISLDSVSNLVTLVATITDADGDTASASMDLGRQIAFLDDGPSLTVTASVAADALVVDETNLAVDATANFADNFAVSSNYGADGAGTTSSAYALTIKSVGADSGLIDVATGQHIYLYTDGADVVGRVGSGGSPDASGTIDFRVSVDASGNVTLDQIHALAHPDASNPDDVVTLSSADLITLTRTDTITDKDLDTATSHDSINIATALSFHDDGPSLTVTASVAADALVVDETNLAVDATANFADNFAVSSNYGADGAGTTSSAYALTIKSVGADSGLIDVATGQHIYLYTDGADVVGRVGSGGSPDASGTIDFRVSVDASGNVTLDQIHALAHPDASNPDDVVTLSSADLITLTRTDTITDKDLDTATSHDSINIATALSFHDDGPSLTVTASVAADALVVDETNLAVDATANFADNFAVSSNYGADGAGTTSSAYALTIKSVGADSGLIDVATGQHIYLYTDGADVVGRVGSGGSPDASGTIDFRVSVDASGNVTLDQIHALAHPDASNPDDVVTLSSADLITLTRTDTITDKDLDTATSHDSINIATALSFHDDGPSLTVTASVAADALVVDETNLAVDATANFADNFAVSSNYGADGAGTTSSAYALTIKSVGADSGLIDVATGQHIYLYTDGADVVGRVGSGGSPDASGTIDFRVSVDASGNVTLDQIHALAHPDASNPDDVVTLSSADLITLTRTDTITDKDLDTATSHDSINIATALSFHDDGPVAHGDGECGGGCVGGRRDQPGGRRDGELCRQLRGKQQLRCGRRRYDQLGLCADDQERGG
ncbi:NAD(P)H-flavin reductase [Bradyrhizobium sp. LM2.7]